MKRTSCCTIIPSRIFEEIARNGTVRQRETAFQNLNATAQLRGQRSVVSLLSPFVTLSPGTLRRTIYDAKNGMQLPGSLVRAEGDPKTRDIAVNEYIGCVDALARHAHVLFPASRASQVLYAAS